TEYNKAKGSYKEPVSSVCYELAVSNKNVLACENMLYHMGLLDIDNGRYIVRSLSHLKGVLVKKKNK
ncbi:MAG: hypothetical protein GY928_06515, partial [Colwellia sp.]|nr:hypothetical protein [Colwellia sp.]